MKKLFRAVTTLGEPVTATPSSVQREFEVEQERHGNEYYDNILDVLFDGEDMTDQTTDADMAYVEELTKDIL